MILRVFSATISASGRSHETLFSIRKWWLQAWGSLGLPNCSLLNSVLVAGWVLLFTVCISFRKNKHFLLWRSWMLFSVVIWVPVVLLWSPISVILTSDPCQTSFSTQLPLTGHFLARTILCEVEKYLWCCEKPSWSEGCETLRQSPDTSPKVTWISWIPFFPIRRFAVNFNRLSSPCLHGKISFVTAMWIDWLLIELTSYLQLHAIGYKYLQKWGNDGYNDNWAPRWSCINEISPLRSQFILDRRLFFLSNQPDCVRKKGNLSSDWQLIDSFYLWQICTCQLFFLLFIASLLEEAFPFQNIIIGSLWWGKVKVNLRHQVMLNLVSSLVVYRSLL